MEYSWHDFKDQPTQDGFYLSLLCIEDNNKYYFDIMGFKDGEWRYRSMEAPPVDINNLNYTYVSSAKKFIKWTELPDLTKLIDQDQIEPLEEN